ncbi:MAG TPA: carbohydrate binding domain-containing protein [Verrucomicrobiae bacterium]|nr:carbohydrate binding domain-containing protein [Verrucomicrobiae bacterium]
MWSFQTGTPNPDGVIRLPGRVFNFLVFGLFGHEAAAYFYAISSLVIAFLAFFYFCRKFLKIDSLPVTLVGSLLFALNPIFLGNMAKVGLVLAAALLPLCLTFIKIAFEKRQLRYLLFYVACLNISFLHPYTLILNTVISGVYLVYLGWRHWDFVRENTLKITALIIGAILANSYIILSLLSMGSVSKDVISANVVPVAMDYTALVGTSNTADLLTGLSLSKEVFLDFLFYNPDYKFIYFAASFSLYILLIVLFIKVRSSLSRLDLRRLLLFSLAFLIFIALAATTIWNIDALIRLLITLPGGWAFRSPLKWQLYIPFVLAGIIVLLMARTSGKLRTYSFAALAIIFIGMNGYVLSDVHKKLLTPRTLENFTALNNAPLENKTLLFVNSPRCLDYMSTHLEETVELNQVLTAKNVQVKRVLVDSIDSINVGSYNYVLSCREKSDLARMLTHQYDFKRSHSFLRGDFQLYENKINIPQVYALENLYGLDERQSVADAYSMTKNNLGSPLSFTGLDNKNLPMIALEDPFSTVSGNNIRENKIITNNQLGSHVSKQELLVPELHTPLYYKSADNTLTLSPQKRPDYHRLDPSAKTQRISLNDKHDKLVYDDPTFKYKNSLSNGSFESGLWQKKVSDCYNYDNKPDISMSLNNTQANDGKQSLQLESKAHIACTGPKEIKVTPGQQYIISFDYLAETGPVAGFSVRFDDPYKIDKTQRIKESGSSWKSFGYTVTVPENATSMKLMLYAYPDSKVGTRSKVLYDNVAVINIPPVKNSFFLLKDRSTKLGSPKIETIAKDPTQKEITITTNDTPFFLATSETYSKLWELVPTRNDSWLPSLSNPATAGEQFALNNTMNAWYIQPSELCRSAEVCQKDASGNYTISLTMRFVPQKWLYLGLILSAVSFVGLVAYCIWEFLHERKHRKRVENAT